MPQYTFSTEEILISEVDKLAERDNRSRSEMIDILLRYAIKEKTRVRHGKKDNIKHNASNIHQNYG